MRLIGLHEGDKVYDITRIPAQEVDEDELEEAEGKSDIAEETVEETPIPKNEQQPETTNDEKDDEV